MSSFQEGGEIMTATKLLQQGYLFVARFNHKERAEERAALHRKQGFQAKVIRQFSSFGVETFAVYIKKEGMT